MKIKSDLTVKLFILLLFVCSFLHSKENFGQIINIENNSFPDDTVSIEGKPRLMHIGWKDGKIPEFSNAYILRPYEFRINVLGRSSLGLSNKVEFSTYLPLIITPNFSLKYKFLDFKHFASALDVGVAGGLFPLAAATGILLPGAAIGGGTIGLLHGNNEHARLFLSLHPTEKLTFSVRGAVSTLHVGYWGLVGFAGLGKDAIMGGLLPVNPSARFTLYSSGFEADYVLNKTNAIVFNTSLGGLKGAKKQLGMATLSWTHAKIHFHYSLGLYGFFDPPSYEMVKNSKLPVSFYGNVYWILNNGKTLYLPKQN